MPQSSSLATILGPPPQEWAHHLVDLHDERVPTKKFARYCEKVALGIRVHAHSRDFR